jgi:hypothetical protein
MSRFVRAILDALVAAGDEVTSGGAARTYQVGLVQTIPWPFGAGGPVELLRALAFESVLDAAQFDRSDETTRGFCAIAGSATDTTIAEVAEQRQRALEEAALRLISRSHESEGILSDHLGLDAEGHRYLDDEFGEHPGAYPALPLEDDALVARYLAEPMDRVIDEIVSTSGGSRSIANLTYVGDRRLEVLAHAFRRHPSVLVELRRERGILPPEEPARTAADLISYLVGVSFGRWDARGPRPAGEFDPFAPVPLCPPAMLVGDDGFPTTVAPPGYPVALPPDGVLLDEPGHGFDLAAAVEAAASVAVPNGEELLADAVSVLGRKSLPEYLAKAFFKEHLGRYSKSRRQAPVYWQLTVPSGQWSAWLYAPRFSREMLYAVVTLADHRLALAGERIEALQRDDSTSARQRQKAVDAERTLTAELQELRDDVARLAGLGWQPDLDDGYVLCAAPLVRWFPKNTWKQLAEQLAAIKKGAYPWAGVHEYRDEL